MLDPFYRTMEGFAVLVSKDWLAFGHKFATRNGHASPDISDSQRSPIFLQFLDCVFQIMSQYPDSFEFNENFLIVMYDAMLSCRCGDFLFDCEKERKVNQVMEKTTSIWTILLSKEYRELYRNPLYQENLLRLIPRTQMRYLKIWESCYLRWDQEYVISFQHQDYPYSLGSLYHRKYELLRLWCEIRSLDLAPFDQVTGGSIEELLALDLLKESENPPSVSDGVIASTLLKTSKSMRESGNLNPRRLVGSMTRHESLGLHINGENLRMRLSGRQLRSTREEQFGEVTWEDKSLRRTTTVLDAKMHVLRQRAEPTFALKMLWPTPSPIVPPE